MAPYKSLLADSNSIKTKWGLADGEAKKVYEIWDMAYDELRISKDKNFQRLRTDAQTYLTQKPGVFDTPNPNLTRVKAEISNDQWNRLLTTYGVLMLMRTLDMGGVSSQQMFSTVWSGIKGKEKGDAAAAKKTAKKFNDVYLSDEFAHYLQYLTGKKKDFRAQKPYVVAGAKHTLYAWY